MALLPYLDESEMPAEPRESLARQPRELNVFRIWAHAKTCFAPSIRFGNAIMTDLALSDQNRELVILAVARLERGSYEWIQHVPVARRVGCSEAAIAALEAGAFESTAFSGAQTALLKFVTELIIHVAATERTIAALKKDLSEREIVEVILVVGFYMMITRLTETIRIEVDGPTGTKAPTFERARSSN